MIIFLSAAYLIFHYPRPLFHKPLSLIAFDRNQNLLGARIASDGQWRISTSDTIPPKYIKALIQAEDHRFYYHIGIDPLALISTLRDHFFKHKKIRGASTIPMQIMRMALGNQDRTFSSKIQEAIYAVYLSVTSSKQKQLSYYANNAPFGGNVVGIEAACWRYYGKSPHLISWAEAAVLALLPNAPSLITLSKNKALLMKKRNRLLRKMLINKILTREEYDLALLEPLPDSFTEIPLDNQHLLTHLDKQPSKTKRFETTIDLDIQNMCREIAEYHLDALTASNINNIAIIVLDNPTGNVLSYIGNTQKQVSGNAVNMITAKRSSGSLLKPLLVTSLFDQGYYSNYSLVQDAPIHINGYAPVNFDKSFRGLVSIEEALQRSLNVPFVNLLKEFSVSRFQNICIKSGLQTLDKPADHYGLSLILGGGEITLWDVAGAYASMARTLTTFRTKESKYTADDWHDPTFFKQALSQNNLTFEPYVFHAGSIYQCFEAMSALKRPDEEGMWEEFSSSKKIAWKTGTSFGNKDAWAIGVNKNYTIGIWLGNANGNGRSNIMGVKIAAPVLFDVFNKLKGNEWFDKPYDDLAKMAICKESGYKANTACINNDTIYLQSSTSKMDLCQYHQIIYLDETNTYQVKYDCYPHHKIKQEVQLMIPAYLSEYYRLHHPEYKPVPSMHPKCAHLSDNSASPLDIIYPINNLVIHPLKLKNGKREEIILRATSINPKGKLYWYLNEEFLGSTFQFHSKSKSLEAGSYTLLITDDEGKTAKVNFQIK